MKAKYAGKKLDDRKTIGGYGRLTAERIGSKPTMALLLDIIKMTLREWKGKF